jgi:hypothetical protein
MRRELTQIKFPTGLGQKAPLDRQNRGVLVLQQSASQQREPL